MNLTRPLCLASSSPRRREILERFGLRFELSTPSVDESPLPDETPAHHVERLSALKAAAVRERFPAHLVLAADTVVVLGKEVLGKPSSVKDAERMLHLLAGNTHEVISGYTLRDGRSGEELSGAVTTQVGFRALPPAWIRWYSRLEESRDKAGAYGIQGIGGAMIEKIAGSYNNVVGLPIEEILWKMMDKGWITL